MTARLPLALALLLPALAWGGSYGPYNVTVVRVVDGDTAVVDVALWPGLTQRISIRLDGVNTPESA